jgi:hypothetical protein
MTADVCFSLRSALGRASPPQLTHYKPRNLGAASDRGGEGSGVIATDDIRALGLCELALSLVEAKGALVSGPDVLPRPKRRECFSPDGSTRMSAVRSMNEAKY